MGGWREVAGDRGQVAVGLGCEDKLQPVLELVHGQPALSEVLAERRSRRLAVGVTDSKARRRRHLFLRWSPAMVTQR
jgi:hypothetical protein